MGWGKGGLKFRGTSDTIWLDYMKEGVLWMTLEEYIQADQNYVYKMTDLYLVSRFWDEPEMERGRLMWKTNYSKSTVQTCLGRLLEEGILERNQKSEEGRYIYSLTDKALKCDKNEQGYNVVNYMYRNYLSLMRPNIALLIFVLIVREKFNVDKLINDECYNVNSVYNAIGKLKKEGIIEKKGGDYRFTDTFLNNVHSFSQQTYSKSIIELFKGSYSKIMGIVANSSGYQGAIQNLMLVYNLTQEEAKEVLELRVGNLIE